MSQLGVHWILDPNPDMDPATFSINYYKQTNPLMPRRRWGTVTATSAVMVGPM